ncbi:hypothetical protein [Pseudomonas sp. 3A(2025)]
MDANQAKVPVSRQIADLDARINAKKTFAARIGLVPACLALPHGECLPV